jgi:hypothetical protein
MNGQSTKTLHVTTHTNLPFLPATKLILMPLLNGQEFELSPVPSEAVIKQLDSDKVFYVPFTGEIFISYE